MVGRLYWASCARATGIDALLRCSPPASCGRLYPAAAGRRILAGDRLYPASRSGYRRYAASLSPCCAAANIRQQQAGGFRWPAVYTGGDKPCVGSGHRCSAAPLSPRVVLLPISAAAVWRLSAGSQLYRTNRARATGIDALLRRSPPRRAAAYIRRQQAGGFRRPAGYTGGTSRARAAGTDVPLRRSPPRCTAAAYIPRGGDSGSAVF